MLERFIFKEISRDKISEDNCVHHPGKFSVIMEGRVRNENEKIFDMNMITDYFFFIFSSEII